MRPAWEWNARKSHPAAALRHTALRPSASEAADFEQEAVQKPFRKMRGAGVGRAVTLWTDALRHFVPGVRRELQALGGDLRAPRGRARGRSEVQEMQGGYLRRWHETRVPAAAGRQTCRFARRVRRSSERRCGCCRSTAGSPGGGTSRRGGGDWARGTELDPGCLRLDRAARSFEAGGGFANAAGVRVDAASGSGDPFPGRASGRCGCCGLLARTAVPGGSGQAC